MTLLDRFNRWLDETPMPPIDEAAWRAEPDIADFVPPPLAGGSLLIGILIGILIGRLTRL